MSTGENNLTAFKAKTSRLSSKGLKSKRRRKDARRREVEHIVDAMLMKNCGETLPPNKSIHLNSASKLDIVELCPPNDFIDEEKVETRMGCILHLGLGRPMHPAVYGNIKMCRSSDVKIESEWAGIAASAVTIPKRHPIISRFLVPVAYKQLYDLALKHFSTRCSSTCRNFKKGIFRNAAEQLTATRNNTKSQNQLIETLRNELDKETTSERQSICNEASCCVDIGVSFLSDISNLKNPGGILGFSDRNVMHSRNELAINSSSIRNDDRFAEDCANLSNATDQSIVKIKSEIPDEQYSESYCLDSSLKNFNPSKANSSKVSNHKNPDESQSRFIKDDFLAQNYSTLSNVPNPSFVKIEPEISNEQYLESDVSDSSLNNIYHSKAIISEISKCQKPKSLKKSQSTIAKKIWQTRKELAQLKNEESIKTSNSIINGKPMTNNVSVAGKKPLINRLKKNTARSSIMKRIWQKRKELAQLKNEESIKTSDSMKGGLQMTNNVSLADKKPLINQRKEKTSHSTIMKRIWQKRKELAQLKNEESIKTSDSMKGGLQMTNNVSLADKKPLINQRKEKTSHSTIMKRIWQKRKELAQLKNESHSTIMKRIWQKRKELAQLKNEESMKTSDSMKDGQEMTNNVSLADKKPLINQRKEKTSHSSIMKTVWQKRKELAQRENDESIKTPDAVKDEQPMTNNVSVSHKINLINQANHQPRSRSFSKLPRISDESSSKNSVLSSQTVDILASEIMLGCRERLNLATKVSNDDSKVNDKSISRMKKNIEFCDVGESFASNTIFLDQAETDPLVSKDVSQKEERKPIIHQESKLSNLSNYFSNFDESNFKCVKSKKHIVNVDNRSLENLKLQTINSNNYDSRLSTQSSVMKKFSFIRPKTTKRNRRSNSQRNLEKRKGGMTLEPFSAENNCIIGGKVQHPDANFQSGCSLNTNKLDETCSDSVVTLKEEPPDDEAESNNQQEVNQSNSERNKHISPENPEIEAPVSKRLSILASKKPGKSKNVTHSCQNSYSSGANSIRKKRTDQEAFKISSETPSRNRQNRKPNTSCIESKLPPKSKKRRKLTATELWLSKSEAAKRYWHNKKMTLNIQSNNAKQQEKCLQESSQPSIISVPFAEENRDSEPGITQNECQSFLRNFTIETDETCVVSDVVEKIVDYACNKEFFDKLEIGFDKDYCPTPDNLMALSSVNPSNRKKNRCDRELARLNVNIINLQNRSEVEPLAVVGSSENCPIESCKFGCICTSLSGKVIFDSVHCSEEKCIFGCVCNFDSNSSKCLAETPSILTPLMKQLHQKSKRSFAAKEFRETVFVCSQNDIGSSIFLSSKKHRNRKLPEKFKDHLVHVNANFMLSESTTNASRVEIGSSEKVCEGSFPRRPLDQKSTATPLNQDPESFPREPPPDTKSKPISLNRGKMLRVAVEKLTIVPKRIYCLFHNRFNCVCLEQDQRKALPNSKDQANATIQTFCSSDFQISEPVKSDHGNRAKRPRILKLEELISSSGSARTSKCGARYSVRNGKKAYLHHLLNREYQLSSSSPYFHVCKWLAPNYGVFQIQDLKLLTMKHLIRLSAKSTNCRTPTLSHLLKFSLKTSTIVAVSDHSTALLPQSETAQKDTQEGNCKPKMPQNASKDPAATETFQHFLSRADDDSPAIISSVFSIAPEEFDKLKKDGDNQLTGCASAEVTESRYEVPIPSEILHKLPNSLLKQRLLQSSLSPLKNSFSPNAVSSSTVESFSSAEDDLSKGWWLNKSSKKLLLPLFNEEHQWLVLDLTQNFEFLNVTFQKNGLCLLQKILKKHLLEKVVIKAQQRKKTIRFSFVKGRDTSPFEGSEFSVYAMDGLPELIFFGPFFRDHSLSLIPLKWLSSKFTPIPLKEIFVTCGKKPVLNVSDYIKIHQETFLFAKSIHAEHQSEFIHYYFWTPPSQFSKKLNDDTLPVCELNGKESPSSNFTSFTSISTILHDHDYAKKDDGTDESAGLEDFGNNDHGKKESAGGIRGENKQSCSKAKSPSKTNLKQIDLTARRKKTKTLRKSGQDDHEIFEPSPPGFTTKYLVCSVMDVGYLEVLVSESSTSLTFNFAYMELNFDSVRQASDWLNKYLGKYIIFYPGNFKPQWRLVRRGELSKLLEPCDPLKISQYMFLTEGGLAVKQDSELEVTSDTDSASSSNERDDEPKNDGMVPRSITDNENAGTVSFNESSSIHGDQMETISPGSVLDEQTGNFVFEEAIDVADVTEDVDIEDVGIEDVDIEENDQEYSDSEDTGGTERLLTMEVPHTVQIIKQSSSSYDVKSQESTAGRNNLESNCVNDIISNETTDSETKNQSVNGRQQIIPTNKQSADFLSRANQEKTEKIVNSGKNQVSETKSNPSVSSGTRDQSINEPPKSVEVVGMAFPFSHVNSGNNAFTEDGVTVGNNCKSDAKNTTIECLGTKNQSIIKSAPTVQKIERPTDIERSKDNLTKKVTVVKKLTENGNRVVTLCSLTGSKKFMIVREKHKIVPKTISGNKTPSEERSNAARAHVKEATTDSGAKKEYIDGMQQTVKAVVPSIYTREIVDEVSIKEKIDSTINAATPNTSGGSRTKNPSSSKEPKILTAQNLKMTDWTYCDVKKTVMFKIDSASKCEIDAMHNSSIGSGIIKQSTVKAPMKLKVIGTKLENVSVKDSVMKPIPLTTYQKLNGMVTSGAEKKSLNEALQTVVLSRPTIVRNIANEKPIVIAEKVFDASRDQVQFADSGDPTTSNNGCHSRTSNEIETHEVSDDSTVVHSESQFSATPPHEPTNPASLTAKFSTSSHQNPVTVTVRKGSGPIPKKRPFISIEPKTPSLITVSKVQMKESRKYPLPGLLNHPSLISNRTASIFSLGTTCKIPRSLLESYSLLKKDRDKNLVKLNPCSNIKSSIIKGKGHKSEETLSSNQNSQKIRKKRAVDINHSTKFSQKIASSRGKTKWQEIIGNPNEVAYTINNRERKNQIIRRRIRKTRGKRSSNKTLRTSSSNLKAEIKSKETVPHVLEETTGDSLPSLDLNSSTWRKQENGMEEEHSLEMSSSKRLKSSEKEEIGSCQSEDISGQKTPSTPPSQDENSKPKKIFQGTKRKKKIRFESKSVRREKRILRMLKKRQLQQTSNQSFEKEKKTEVSIQSDEISLKTIPSPHKNSKVGEKRRSERLNCVEVAPSSSINEIKISSPENFQSEKILPPVEGTESDGIQGTSTSKGNEVGETIHVPKKLIKRRKQKKIYNDFKKEDIEKLINRINQLAAEEKELELSNCRKEGKTSNKLNEKDVNSLAPRKEEHSPEKEQNYITKRPAKSILSYHFTQTAKLIRAGVDEKRLESEMLQMELSALTDRNEYLQNKLRLLSQGPGIYHKEACSRGCIIKDPTLRTFYSEIGSHLKRFSDRKSRRTEEILQDALKLYASDDPTQERAPPTDSLNSLRPLKNQSQRILLREAPGCDIQTISVVQGQLRSM